MNVLDAFEVTGYQIVGKSGKSMDSVSRCDVLQRIRRGEQAIFSIFFRPYPCSEGTEKSSSVNGLFCEIEEL